MAVDFSAGSAYAAVCDGNERGGYTAMEVLDPETPETILTEAETSRILGATLSGLTFEHQQVVLLHVGDGLTFAEIAVILGITKQSAHARYQLAIERMRTSLAVMGIRERRGLA